MNIRSFLIGPFLLLFGCNIVYAENKLTIKVNAGQYNRENSIVSADMSRLGDALSVQLFELVDGKEHKVECQIDSQGVLYWILEGYTAANTSRTFIAKKGKQSKKDVHMQTIDNGKSLIIKKNEEEVLQYNYATVYPPAGVDSSYQRSGFIHPAYSPKGNVLTTIQPKDHYHHYGIWNPWTRLEYEGKIYDLWNLVEKQGTVRARNIQKVYTGNVFTGFQAVLEHYVFKPEKEEVVIDELWNVKAWNYPEGFLWDFESTLKPSTAISLIIRAYRYAGFGWRATEEWTKENSEMLTSEGKTRQQIDGTNARWIYVTGTCGRNGRSGFLLLSHPLNYSAPEPLRIWDENANGGRGDVFVNFAPTKNKDWELMPGNEYKLRYRVLTYDGEMTKERAESLWNAYVFPPKVVVE